MNSTPESARTWGIVILILGALSLFGLTTTLGGILAIIGGGNGSQLEAFKGDRKDHSDLPSMWTCSRRGHEVLSILW